MGLTTDGVVLFQSYKHGGGKNMIMFGAQRDKSQTIGYVQWKAKGNTSEK